MPRSFQAKTTYRVPSRALRSLMRAGGGIITGIAGVVGVVVVGGTVELVNGGVVEVDEVSGVLEVDEVGGVTEEVVPVEVVEGADDMVEVGGGKLDVVVPEGVQLAMTNNDAMTRDKDIPIL